MTCSRAARPSPLLAGFQLILVLLLCSSCLPSLLADPDGFISIDFGATSVTVVENITWIVDSSYTAFGSVSKVKVNATVPYDTLRYFPNITEKTCITLDTTVNSSYLLRAGFLYGNYDGQYNSTANLPKFSLLFDGNDWANVSFNNMSETVLHEIIYLATRDTSNICVARSDEFDPFISSLEIRKLPAAATSFYTPIQKMYLMRTNSRIDLGDQTGSVTRYPYDMYDRIWDSDSAIQNISMYERTLNESITSQNENLPTKVMQTARISNSSVMSFDFTANYGRGSYFIAFYFAAMNSSFIGPMNITLGNQSVVVNNTSPLWMAVSDNYTVYDKSYSLQLSATSSRPFLNAEEAYFLQSVNPGTFAEDVNALEGIKSMLNLSSSMGDPCVPNRYMWSWITCSSTSPTRVITLNLSSRGLQSEIPPTIANLSALSSIDLHNNSFFGVIPLALLDLTNLTVLDLRNNNLSGVVPKFRSSTVVRVEGNEGLCQANCDASAPSLVPASAPEPENTFVPTPKTNTAVILGSVLGGILFLVVLLSGYILFGQKLRRRRKLFSIHSAHWPPVPHFTEISRAVDSSVGTLKGSPDDVPVYSFADMQVITNNFGKMLASERFGSLFYGTLPGGEEVVVKVLQSNIQISPLEFLNQVSPLSYVNHRNLLRPIGFCAESHRLMFVYEHVPKGSLYDHLYSNEPVDWRTRLNILQQVAQGLEYLHCGCNPGIIHGNLKSTNVLMSRDGAVAKITDFGIYGLSPNVDATSGYLDPQYFVNNRLTEESDVYSFGVLTLEVVCGRLPFDTNLPKEAWNIVDWVRKMLERGNYEPIVDPCLYDSWSLNVVSKIVQLALRATEADMRDRPTMSEMATEFKEAYRIEPSNHVVFAEMEPNAASSSPDVPLTVAFSNRSHD